MANFFTDNEDLQFYVDEVIPWRDLHEASTDRAPWSPEIAAGWRDLVEAIGELVGDQIAPYVAAIDREGVHLEDGEVRHPPRLEAINRQMSELGLHKLMLPQEVGGLGAPFIVYLLACEMFARADPAIMTHFAFHGGLAMTLLGFSLREGTTRIDPVSGRFIETRFGAEIAEMIDGRAWGSMDITEPDCGSDMAAIRTRAVRGDDGVWRLSGQKIFITSGHGKYHIVIAKSGRDPSLPPSSKEPGMAAGLDELGVFLVPAWEALPDGTRKRHIKLLRAEDKLGHHASATMVVELDDAPGQLIGKAGEGFAYMLKMMNGARVGVSCEAVGMLEATLRVTELYAAERRSMGKAIAEHEMIADYLDEMRADTLGLRALAMRCAVHTELAERLDYFGNVPQQARSLSRARSAAHHRTQARELTPLLKYLAAEQAVLHARRGLQIHGGVGYTTDYAIEKIYRDAPVLPIYEGTSQIQALMAMKDQLGAAIRAPQELMRKEAEARWRAMSARDPLERATSRLRILGLSAVRHLVLKTAASKLLTLRGRPLSAWRSTLTSGWDPKRDFSWAMLHAERLTRILADAAVADTLLEQTRSYPQRADRREVLEAHLERAEPRAHHLLEQITTTGGRLLGKLARSRAVRETETG